ncbi:MAG: GGDEF domain-containing protein [Lachnospiraceae bacterium]|nr:GGDEF domain-containing protein [Lachnospiraceae bacterium]
MNSSCMAEELLVNEAFRAILEHTADMMFIKNADLVYVAVSRPFVKMVGKERADQIIGHTDAEIFEDENLAGRYVADDRRLLNRGVDLIDYIEPITDEEGQARYGSTSKFILWDKSGKAAGILGITKDITRTYIARKHYQQELQYLFELPQDTYAVSYIDVDDWRIISQRRRLIGESTLQACHTVESLCEAARDSILDKESEAAEFYEYFTPELLRDIYHSGRSRMSFTYQRLMPDGSVRWIQNEVRFMSDVDNGHLCVMLSAKDIDAKKQKEQQLMFAAQMDQMTMLLNRETTMNRIEQVLKEEADKKHVLFMLDVDNFKRLNDTLGHQAGDNFLIAFAAGIKGSFRESDVVGRIGGDEFFALMRDFSEISRAAGKAEELLSAIQKVCAIYPEVQTSGSIGISVYPDNGRTLEDLYAQADAALYKAKRKGKNQFVFASL